MVIPPAGALNTRDALLPIVVGAMNINEFRNINDIRQSATIFPRPCKLTFDLLTLKVVSESRVTWATCVPISFVFLYASLFSSYSRCTRQTDVRQTDVRHHRLMPRLGGEGIIISWNVYDDCHVPIFNLNNHRSSQFLILLCPAPNRQGH